MGYFADDLKQNLTKFTDYWQQVTEPAAKVVTPIAQGLIDLKNSKIVYDPCNIGVRIGSTGGKLVFYRNPYCQPSPVPKSEEQQLRKMDLSGCGGISFRAIYSTKNLGFYYDPVLNGFRPRLLASTLDEIFNLFLKKYPDYEHSKYDFYSSGGGTGSNPYNNLGNGVSYRTYQQIGNGCGPDGDPYSYLDSFPSYYASGGNIEVTGSTSIVAINAILDHLSSAGFTPEIDNIQLDNPNGVGCPSRKPTPEPPPPKPPKPKMECCPGQENNDALLKLILKRIGEPQKVTIFDEDMERKGTQKADKTPESLNKYFELVIRRVEIVNRLLGIDNYPMTVPDTMIEPFKEGAFAKIFGFIDGKKKRKINSLTELIAWMSEQDSAVLGEFHQVIQFEAEDNKTTSIVIPNVAEALKELVLLVSQMAKQTNVQTDLLFRMGAELVATRADTAKATAIIEDIQDYLDYPTQRKTKSIPSCLSLPTISVNKKGIPIATAKTEDHKEFLKAGENKFVYEDWTGSNSLHDQLLDLLHLASMLRAIYFQPTNKQVNKQLIEPAGSQSSEQQKKESIQQLPSEPE